MQHDLPTGELVRLGLEDLAENAACHRGALLDVRAVSASRVKALLDPGYEGMSISVLSWLRTTNRAHVNALRWAGSFDLGEVIAREAETIRAAQG